MMAMQHTSPALALSVLVEKIAYAFPDFPILNPRLIEQRWDHQVVIFSDDLVSGAYVFRFPRTEVYRRRLKDEIALLELIAARTTVSVPRYDRVAPYGSFGGYPLIEGYALDPTTFHPLSSEDQAALAHQTGAFLAVVHTLTPDVAASLRLPTANGKDERQAEFAAEQEVIFAFFSHEEKASLESFLAEFWSLLPAPHTTVIHDDFSGHHTLMTENILAGIIDFGDAALGDPALDFAELWEFGQEFVTRTYASYNGPRDDDFISRSRYYFYELHLRHIFDATQRKDDALLALSLRRTRELLVRSQS